VRVYLAYSTSKVDSSKPLLEGPYHTRIARPSKAISIRLLCGMLTGFKFPNLLLFRTTIAVVVLIIFWIGGKFCVEWF
jgi:hypothetical protein